MSWPHPNFEPQVRHFPASNTWRCFVRKLPDGPFRSLEGPGVPSHTTSDAAVAAASQRVSDLLAARQESLAVEVVRLLVAVPARLRPVSVPNPEGGPDLRYWQARADSTAPWTDPVPSPYEATRIALGRPRED